MSAPTQNTLQLVNMAPSYVPPAIIPTGTRVAIVPDGDFVIRLAPPMTPLRVSSTTVTNRAQAIDFLTFRDVLIASSTYFRALLRPQPMLSVLIIDENAHGIGKTLELWLHAIHGSVNSIPTHSKAASRRQVWSCIAVGERFGFLPHNAKCLLPWFLAYYHLELTESNGLTPMIARCLTFPCSIFDHAEGFMKLTKYLTYNTTGELFSHNSSSHEILDINARILDGPLVAAKNHIEYQLHQALYAPMRKLHHAGCACRKETAYDYETTLIKLDCWPVDQALKKVAISELIERLKQFKYTSNAATSCQSRVCAQNFNKSIEAAIKATKGVFDGLCLDCMNRSKCSSLSRQAYIEKNSPYNGCWDIGCRFGHGRETWFASWMGSSQMRQQILSEEKSRKLRHTNRTRNRPPVGKNAHSQQPRNQTLANRSVQIGFETNQEAQVDHAMKYDDDDDDEFFDATETGSLGSPGKLDEV